MNIAVISHFGPGYSGGRIYAWFIIEALATLGHRVTVYSDSLPAFKDEFAYMPAHNKLEYVTAPYFSFEMAGGHDTLFCIPDLGGHWILYHKVMSYVRRNSCRLVLISYETPNWKNFEQPTEHLISEDYGSMEVSFQANMILAISKISRDMAKNFFTQSKANFCYLCPPIHDYIADNTPEPSVRQKRILIISRFKPRYKNSHRFVEILSEACNDYEFVFIENGLMNQGTLEAYSMACTQYGATFRVVRAISEKEKFKLIKNCSLTIYPSTFEGYGIPPVESLYCGVPCVTFDLPVLRQVHGNDLIYARKGDFAHFRETVADTLKHINEHTVDRKNLNCNPAVATFVKNIEKILYRLQSNDV